MLLIHYISCQFQGRANVIDVTRLPVIRKRVKPLSKQGAMESRRLWNEVTNALGEGDISRATEHKRNVSVSFQLCSFI